MMSHRPVIVSLLSGLLALSPAACGAPAPAAAPTEHRVETGDEMRLEWRGGPTAILEKGGLRILTDPMLSLRGPAAFVLPKHPSTGAPDAKIARYTDPPAHPLGELSLIILSHNHADHFDQRARELLPKKTLFVLPPNAVEDVRANGFENLRPLDWDQETVVERGGTRLRIIAVPAHHSHDPAIATSVGKGNGYVLRWEGAEPYTVYWTGDAVLTEDASAIARRFSPIDLWLPHMGGVGGDSPLGLRTMDADEAVKGMEILRPRLTVPIHHTTFGHYREPIEALEQRVALKKLTGLRVPREGVVEVLHLESTN